MMKVSVVIIAKESAYLSADAFGFNRLEMLNSGSSTGLYSVFEMGCCVEMSYQ